MKAVVFDLGNVLIRWQPEAALSHLFDSPEDMARVLAEIDFAGWNLEQDRGRSWDDGVAAGREAHPEQGHVFAAYAEGLAAAHREPISGTIALLERLHAVGTPLFAITNASERTVELVAEMHGFMPRFGDVVISGVEGVAKPDHGIFNTFLARNGYAPEDCLFIDDSPRNVEAARAVGMAAHHFTTADELERDLVERGFL